MSNRDWYRLNIDEVFVLLGTSVSGLTTKEAQERFLKFGPNQIQEEKKVSKWFLFLGQFKNFLIVILIVAVVISGILGEYIEAGAILAIVIFAAILGFFQEYKAEKAIEALKKMAALKVKVIRESKERELPTNALVPGDIILLVTGDKIPADARLLEAINLKVEEAALTGESQAVDKISDALTSGKEIPLGDRRNMVFMGTVVTYGRAKAVVVATGMQTEFGKIAAMLSDIKKEKTPLQVSINRTAKGIGILALLLSVIIGLAGILKGYTFGEMLLWAVALAVAIVPEALPAVMTVTLCLGAYRMTKRNALIRKLQAVETLGCTSVICSDKTGTLTEGKMTVRKGWVNRCFIEVQGQGYEPKGDFLIENKVLIPLNDEHLKELLIAGLLCNDSQLLNVNGAWVAKGDPTEVALVVLAAKAGINEELRHSFPRQREIPFSSERKRMTTIHKASSSNSLIAYSKGAVEVILESCSYIFHDSQKRLIMPQDKEEILERTQEMARQSLRVLALSYKRLNGNSAISDAQIESDMVFLGLAGIIDPPRIGVKGAVEVCKSAGIKPVMITGDHKETAVAIAKELGIQNQGRTLTGAQLDSLSERDFEEIVEEVEVYARVSPVHKLRIVEAWQKKNRIVAMTGDGVNDAPALKKADIGVAMGITGTDVSKEASDMVLVDDNFVSIVGAIKEGRIIFLNIRKFLTYLLTDNMGAVLAYTFAITFGFPLPLTALQILYINLIMDGPKAIALGLEPAEPGIMNRPSRPPQAGILNRPSLLYILGVGSWICLTTLTIFVFALGRGRLYAMTMFFATLIMMRTFNAFNCRSASTSVFKLGLFRNRWLILAFLLTCITLLPIIYIPFLQKIFEVAPLNYGDWMIVLLGSSSVLLVVEIAKFLQKMRYKPKFCLPATGGRSKICPEGVARQNPTRISSDLP